MLLLTLLASYVMVLSSFNDCLLLKYFYYKKKTVLDGIVFNFKVDHNDERSFLIFQ